MTLTGRAAPVAAAVLVAALSGCGAGAGADDPAPAPAARVQVVHGISTAAVERALLRRAPAGAPHPVAAACRAASATELRAVPFGRTRRPVFSCAMTVTGGQGAARVAGRYDVQVLANGCYVAERRARRPRLGQAVYGCGVSGAGR